MAQYWHNQAHAVTPVMQKKTTLAHMNSSSSWFINAMTNRNAVQIESSNNTITSNK